MAAERIDKIDVLEKDLRRVMEMKPDYAHAYNALGYTLAEKTDRLDEAKALIEKAVKLSPDDPFILDSLGWVYYRLGRSTERSSTCSTPTLASRPGDRRAPGRGPVEERPARRARRRSGAPRSATTRATSRCSR
jgi:tetratricopeptide (TPR) repeat protein